MGRRLRAIAGLAGFVVATVLIFRGLFAVVDRLEAHGSNVIVVGSKAFSENLILAEMFAQLIEHDTGLEVWRKHNLGGTHICFQAVRAGEIDLYPEYTGTGLMAILDEPVVTDPVEALSRVRAGFAEQHGLVWLDPLAFNNAYALAMSRERATALGVSRISDLAGKQGLVAGFPHEFLARGDGYPGLRVHYQLELDARSMEAGLMYQAAASGDVDVISAYATDARIGKMDLVVLEDDARFFPPYQAAPLVRKATLELHPRIRASLAALAGSIDDAQMRELNAAVDVDGRDPADVARTYLRDRGLLGDP